MVGIVHGNFTSTEDNTHTTSLPEILTFKHIQRKDIHLLIILFYLSVPRISSL